MVPSFEDINSNGKNEGAAGVGMGIFPGMNLGSSLGHPQQGKDAGAETDIRTKLKGLKALFEDDLIPEKEFQAKKQQLLDQL